MLAPRERRRRPLGPTHVVINGTTWPSPVGERSPHSGGFIILNGSPSNPLHVDVPCLELFRSTPLALARGDRRRGRPGFRARRVSIHSSRGTAATPFPRNRAPPARLAQLDRRQRRGRLGQSEGAKGTIELHRRTPRVAQEVEVAIGGADAAAELACHERRRDSTARLESLERPDHPPRRLYGAPGLLGTRDIDPPRPYAGIATLTSRGRVSCATRAPATRAAGAIMAA